MFVLRWPTILHADLDSFYASVEQRDDAALRGRPVIVGMGVVLAASYEAKACGVRTAMGGREARRLCPRAAFVTPRMKAYSQASHDVFEIFAQTSPLVEALSIDEAFLDVRGLEHILGGPQEIAVRLRRRVLEEIGLAITVGVASTKFLAKVASAVAKPDGLMVVPVGSELAFLHPLPVQRLWGVGRVTAARLRENGIVSVRQVARLDEQQLIEMLGRASGRKLHALANNRDPRLVRRRARRRSIGAQRALGRLGGNPAEVHAALLTVVERVARRLRAAERACRTVVLRLRLADFARITRSHTMAQATTRTATILRVARELLLDAAPLISRRGLTLVGVALTNLCDQCAIQLALPFDRSGRLDNAVDELRDRFGAGVIARAALVGRSSEPWVPLLPD
jgi:DNA polymerase-4